MAQKRWVVRWNGTDPSLDRTKVVMLFPAVWHADKIAAQLEIIYVWHEWRDFLDDVWKWSAHRRSSRLRPLIGIGAGIVSCGHNPYLEARLEAIEAPRSDASRL